MIEVWRIVRKRHAATAFSGEGTRRYGGRWNHPGTAVIYTAASQSLAILEVLVGLDPEDAPAEFALLRAVVPDGVPIKTMEAATLPPGWNVYPGPEALRDLGDAWARSGGTCVLSIPSAIVPRERNYLLSPSHPDMASIRIDPAESFTFDPRLWKTGAPLH
ncbi:MAG: RES family NAD+ phosphorylase [Deltaproteobacteria bacterium]|nr:RES family NAD+ phosphorylase [Deltaproteobacteria bacterium]